MYACVSYLYMCVNATYCGDILLESKLHYMFNFTSINNNSNINSILTIPE